MPIDFGKLADAYVAANWKWGAAEDRHFPSKEELKDVVDELLSRQHIGTGGLSSEEENGEIVIYASGKLKWILE